jgi:dTDP-glucose 4,6-dehydratase
MHLLVTGGAGFIGSHFVLRHREAVPDDTIVLLDSLTYAGNKEYLAPVLERIRFIQGDIADVELLTKLCSTYAIDVIVNFAAETHVDRSIQNAVPFLHTNVLGVQSLIEVCKAKGVRLLHVSTDEVYGDIADGERPRKVGDCLFPSSPYAASKAAGEMLLLAAMRTNNIKVCISRCTNNYGSHQALEKFIPTVIRHALRDEAVPVYAKGLNRRDWLYVADHCDGLELLLKTPWAFDDDLPLPSGERSRGGGHIFNIAANEERQNIDVAKMILHILGKPESLLQFVADRPGHDWRYAIDSTPIRALGWEPKVKFETGLRKTVEWYRELLQKA